MSLKPVVLPAVTVETRGHGYKNKANLLGEDIIGQEQAASRSVERR